MTEHLERPGGSVAFEDSGSGRLVVAAPGMGDLRASYRHLRPLLTEAGLRLVAFDLRGVGESSVEWADYSDAALAGDYLALIEYLDSGPAVLVGNSLTASSAVIAATQAQDAVSALVLIGPFVRDVPMPAWQRWLFRAMLTPPWGRSAWIGYYRKQMYPLAPPPDHADYVGALAANLKEPGRFKGFRSLAFNSHAESASRLDRVAVPALIVMGTADPDFRDPAAEAQWISDRLNGSLTLVEGAGHYPHAEAPDVVGPAIVDFLEKSPA